MDNRLQRYAHEEGFGTRKLLPYGGAIQDDRVSSLRRLWGLVRRRWAVFGVVFLTVLLFVALFTFTRTRLYTATAGMVVNSRELNLAEKDKDVLPLLPTSENAADTEVEILRSTAVAANTVRVLDLIHNPLYTKGLGSLPASTRLAAVTGMVKADLKIDRPGGANVVAISFTSSDPAMAKAVADQVGREYLNVKQGSRRAAVSNVDKGLGNELEDLRSRLQSAEADVAAYKATHNLLSTDGVTLTETELSLYKQQDAAARATQAEESARLRTAREQLAHGSSGDDVGAALQSPVIQQLRKQRSDVSTRLADLQSRYRADHPDLIRTRDQLADIDRDIRAEIDRVISNLEANARIAADRAATARSTANATAGTLAANNAAGVKLAELQRKADGLKDSYQTLLTRRNSIRSQALVADEDARLFSPALLPLQPSAPNRSLMLCIGALLATIAGAMVIWVLEIFNRGIAGSRDVELQLGLPNLASVPSIRSVARGEERHIPAIDFGVDRPLSLYAEALRSIRLALTGPRPGGAPVLAGITSSRPGEGKTTLAVSLARMAAQSGSRTLLIDADMRRPTVAHLMGIRPLAGLVEVLHGDVPVAQAMVRDANTDLMILPLRAPYPGGELFDAVHIDALVKSLRNHFDLIIFDVAPTLVVADARQLLRQLDEVILAVQWRVTPRETVLAALRQLHQLGMAPLGVVLTQVDMAALARSGYAEEYGVESPDAHAA